MPDSLPRNARTAASKPARPLRPILLSLLILAGSLAIPPGEALALVKASPAPDAGGRESADGESGGSGALPISGVASDPSYGKVPANPVRTGGGQPDGFSRARRYLSGLFGPAGEPLVWRRVGACCHRERPSLEPLEMYELSGGTLPEPIVLYLDPYSRGEVKAPAGFSNRPAKGPNP